MRARVYIRCQRDNETWIRCCTVLKAMGIVGRNVAQQQHFSVYRIMIADDGWVAIIMYCLGDLKYAKMQFIWVLLVAPRSYDNITRRIWSCDKEMHSNMDETYWLMAWPLRKCRFQKKIANKNCSWRFSVPSKSEKLKSIACAALKIAKYNCR